ncbi:hypothetical protein ABW19_dt0208364 [Dactylella cylindrospora]|nr:hypothetical protein ABW19_dt0208364 [Dactylella cylindrospora]
MTNRKRKSKRSIIIIKNPENVKTTGFKGPGRDPRSLIGKRIVSVSDVANYPRSVVITLAGDAKALIEIHIRASSFNFIVEISDQLRAHLAKASNDSPVKITGAASGYKKVVYAAPLCRTTKELKELKATKVTDEFTLIGLKLEGMTEMGWIWGEDYKRSFKEGKLKADAYIADDANPGRTFPSHASGYEVEGLSDLTDLPSDLDEWDWSDEEKCGPKEEESEKPLGCQKKSNDSQKN